MARLNIQENNITFHISEGDLHEVANEDGIGHYPISFVIAEINNESYVYHTHFLAKFVSYEDHDAFCDSKQLCEKFIDTVKEYGSINLDKWNLVEPQEYNLQDELRKDFLNEQFERQHNIFV